MDKNLQKTIEGIGFDSKEANVYLACLELDGVPNTQIARKTGLNRITNYEILKRLERRGVITSFKKKNTKYFIAVDPRIVIKQARERIAGAEETIPEFLAIVNQLVKKPKIYFFEGLDGIKTTYEDSLNAKTEILTFTNPADIYSFLGREYPDNYVSQRVKKGISVRSLAPDDEISRHEQEISHKVLRETRLFPRDMYTITNEIMIYDDKIAVFSGKDEIGLIIENRDLTSSFRSIWQMAWDNAEQFNKN